MSNDVLTISIGRLAGLLEGLGIEPDVRRIQMIHMEGGLITVVRKRQNENGVDVVNDAGTDVLTETTTIGIGG